MSAHDREPRRPRNPPRTPERAEKQREYTDKVHAAATDVLRTLEEGQLREMFSLLGNHLLSRIREEEFEIIRLERFPHERREDTLRRHEAQLDRYRHDFRITAAIQRLIQVFDGDILLRMTLRTWAANLAPSNEPAGRGAAPAEDES